MRRRNRAPVVVGFSVVGTPLIGNPLIGNPVVWASVVWAVVMIAICGALPRAAANDLIQMTEQSFIQNVFGNQHSDPAARKHTEESLQVRIRFVENSVALTDAQRSKLELAGRGDIHRFFTDYERVKRGMTFGGIPRDEWQAVWQRTQPLSIRFSTGLHGPTSLFSKTIASTLDADQRTQFAKLQREHDVAIYVDYIRMTLALMDRKVPLTRAQRESLTELLVKDSSPPNFYGQTQSHVYVVLAKMADLSEKDLKPIFTDTEWAVVSKLMRQGKLMQRSLDLQRKELEK